MLAIQYSLNYVQTLKIRFCSTSEVEELNMLFCWLENVLLQLHISLIERFLELLRTGMIDVL